MIRAYTGLVVLVAVQPHVTLADYASEKAFGQKLATLMAPLASEHHSVLAMLPEDIGAFLGLAGVDDASREALNLDTAFRAIAIRHLPRILRHRLLNGAQDHREALHPTLSPRIGRAKLCTIGARTGRRGAQPKKEPASVANTHQRGPQVVLRSKTPDGVLQGMYGYLLTHYAVRALMHEAAAMAHEDPDRLFFIRSLRVVKRNLDGARSFPPEPLATVHARVVKEILEERLPARRLRANPRVVKRKMSNFARKRLHHRSWPQPTRRSAQAIRIKDFKQTELSLARTGSTMRIAPVTAVTSPSGKLSLGRRSCYCISSARIVAMTEKEVSIVHRSRCVLLGSQAVRFRYGPRWCELFHPDR